uniref:Potassium channel tetramerisation-type BTB domain-containing protein n=1 Tax=Salvator merianae TaxID=96440 RepID=A0A8D0BGA2_SALMN
AANSALAASGWPSMATPAGKVTLNVGGTRFDVYCSTLQAFPGTKLCSITEPQADTTFDYNASSREFFFDRSAKVFGQVLNYCRTKHLHCPTSICWSALEEELVVSPHLGSVLGKAT